MAGLLLIHFASHHAAHVSSPSRSVHKGWQVTLESLRFHQGEEGGDKKPFMLHQKVRTIFAVDMWLLPGGLLIKIESLLSLSVLFSFEISMSSFLLVLTEKEFQVVKYSIFLVNKTCIIKQKGTVLLDAVSSYMFNCWLMNIT